ncbi:hypothetical protein Pcinc_001010 [Petrolisthes cinctipes]|uniref:Reverse transcriptase domain-containing protein n=1 Tax=Petrolisthes cinctipes TaxID=88211 RepID=A0AAE1GM63_PETCI|nr:hypothetical protein Pcinc_001010 [Petrolisthes cinctipes]
MFVYSFLPQPTRALCAASGCTMRVSPDRHLHCSPHAPCFTPLGYDPLACGVCRPWAELCRVTSPSARSKLPALASLRMAWTRARRMAHKRDGSSLAWVDPILGADLGLFRTRYPSSCLSESQGLEPPEAREIEPPSLGGTTTPSQGLSPRETSESVALVLLTTSPSSSSSSSSGSFPSPARKSRKGKRGGDSPSSRKIVKIFHALIPHAFPGASVAQPPAVATEPALFPLPPAAAPVEGASPPGDVGVLFVPPVSPGLESPSGDVAEELVTSAPPSPSPPPSGDGYLPYSWSLLPPTWTHSSEEGRLVAWSPDTAQPDVWIRRDDVLVKWGADEKGEAIPFYKVRPISAPVPTSSRVFSAATLDAMGFLVEYSQLHLSGAWRIDRSHGNTALLLSPDAYFPGDKGEGDLDIPALLLKSLDHQRNNAPRKPPPPSFPVILPHSRAPPGLRECLWKTEKEPPVPYQLKEPDGKLRQAESATRLELAHTISTGAAASLIRDCLNALTNSYHEMSGVQLADTLSSMATVMEGVAAMATHFMREEAKAFAEARLAARQAAAKSAPEMAQRGVVRAAPLSPALFDQPATDTIFASLPAHTTGPPRGASSRFGEGDRAPSPTPSPSPPSTTPPRRTAPLEGPTLGCLTGWSAAWPTHGWAARIIRQGLSWPWITVPPLRLPPASTKVSLSVVPHVLEMREKGVVERATGRVFLSRLFTVPKKDQGKTRLVMDLSKLNKFVKTLHFRMVSVAQVRTVLRKGDWLASLDLKDAYWHVLIHPRFRRFLAFQVGTETFQFTRLPFGLSLAPRVFTKLVRVVASRLAEAGVPTLMYLDDWLLHAPSKEQVANNVQVARGVLEEMGFLLNIPKSSLTPTRKLCWLGIEWDSLSATLSLAPDNARRTLRHVRQAHFSRTFSRRQWESLLGSLNFAAPAMPLGRLKHRRLTREVNLHLSPAHRDLPRQVSPSLHLLLRPWLRPGALRQRVPWVFPPPGITVATDASDIGWGYQSCLGHQRCVGWKEGERLLHINARELMVAKEWLNRHPQFARIGVRFDMDNVAAVQCLQKQGTARSEILLSLSEQIFAIAAKRDIHLSARYVPGRENDWADALSRFRGTSVEWQLRPLVFESLCLRYGTPEVDLFASPSTALLPLFLTFSSRTEAGGPDAFTEDWNRWGHLYLFPPTATSVLLKAILKLRTFRGRVLLIAPLWPAQPWFGELSGGALIPFSWDRRASPAPCLHHSKRH